MSDEKEGKEKRDGGPAYPKGIGSDGMTLRDRVALALCSGHGFIHHSNNHRTSRPNCQIP